MPMPDTHASDSLRGGIRPVSLALLLVAFIWLVFSLVASQSPLGATAWERSWIEVLRSPADPTQIIGPRIVAETFRDFSALGGYAVVLSVLTSYATYTGLRYGRPSVRFFLLTVLAGFACSMLLKLGFGRDRPATVPHLSFVATTSFPSGHAMMSSIAYVTIGLLISQQFADRRLRRMFVAFPLCLTAMVGVSRVAMGVHYPTDVLAGWTGGLLWTTGAFCLRAWLGGPRSDAPASPMRSNEGSN